MGVVATKVIFNTSTGLVEDQVVHDYAFRWDGPTGPTDSELGELAAILVDFYNDIPLTQTLPLAGYMSYDVSRAANATRIAMYSVDELGDPLGSPQVVSDFTLGGAASDFASLPSEVAVVLSMNADLTDVPERVGATRPASRRRGRLFFGPLTTRALALGDNGAGVQRPHDSLQDDLRAAALILFNAAADIMPLNAGLFWSIYSTTDVAARTLVRVWTDNAFDTQRRRGPDATARQITDLT